MSKQVELERLIEEGKLVYEQNFQPADMSKFTLDNISGEAVDLWMKKVKIFTHTYCKGHILYDDIMNTYDSSKTGNSLRPYKDLMASLNSLLEDNNFIKIDLENEKNVESDLKSKMLFISHSTMDSGYVNPFVKLLETIGFRSKDLLFCSSLSGYRIPTSEPIYNYLKSQFNKELHVIFILSENYYNSAACLNEMGATWIKGLNHTAALAPEYDYSQLTGAIDASKIWIKLDDRERLNELKDTLISGFNLDVIDNNIWERKRDEYLAEIKAEFDIRKYKTNPRKVDVEEILPIDDDNILCIARFINKSNENVKCKKLNIELKDGNSQVISFSIDFFELNKIAVYRYENKRVEFIVSRSKILGIEKFDVLSFSSFSTNSNWSLI